MAAELPNNGNGYDIPAHPGPSSVGEIIYPPVPATEQRKKGFYPHVVEDQSLLVSLVSEFAQFPFGEETESGPVTRYSERVVVVGRVLLDLTEEARQTLIPFVEGLIPLQGCGEELLEDCCILYLGKNQPDRTTPYERLETQISQVTQVFSAQEETTGHDMSPFQIRILTESERIDPAVVRQYGELYQVFGWEYIDVVNLLNNPHNTLVAAFEGESIVSSGMAERANLTIRRGEQHFPFIMYEMTEAATREPHRKRGLYTAVATEMMRFLASTDVHLAYAESNAEAPGVLKAAHRLGRHHSLNALEQFGFPARLLEQHVRISAGMNDRRPPQQKNDLLPTFMSRNQLIQQYGS